MKKIIIWFLLLISLAALLLRFGGKGAEFFLGIKQTSGISILSQPQDAVVYIDGKEVGKTPYEDKNLDVTDYTIKIEKDGASWQGKVKLVAGTVTIVNRDIASGSAQTAWEILTLEKGKGLTVISNPPASDVEVDGQSYGKTPTTVNVSSGEHTILISHPNYLKRSIRADLPDKYNLTVAVDLALSEADLTTISTPVITQTPEVVVKNTPTGFLRVREKPNLYGKEIGRVAPGEILVLLEEQASWYRVRLPNGAEGFVSSSYVEKKQ